MRSTIRARGMVISRKRIAPSISPELLKVSDCTSEPTRTTSSTPIALSSEVSFISAMKSFRSGGITVRTACGTTTCCIAFPWLIPSERAASICPRGTDSRPAR